MDEQRADSQGPSEQPALPLVPLNQLGQLIAGRRRERGLTLADVARQSGVSAATISRWERQAVADGQSPERDRHKVAAVARWLGVRVDLGPATASEPLVPSDTIDVIAAHLRADPRLDSKTAAVLGRIFRAAYEEMAGSDVTPLPDRHTRDDQGL